MYLIMDNMEYDAGARPLVCLPGDNLRSYLVGAFCGVQCRDSRSSKHAAGSNQFGVSEQHAGPSGHDSSGKSATANPSQNIKVQTSPKVTEVLNSPPLIIKGEDTQIIRLKKMRFNIALTEAKDRYSLFKKGISKLYDLIDVGQRVLSAQADLAQSPEERADVLQKQLEIYAGAEDNLQKQIKEGKAENADLDHLRYERLGVEIDLEVLRRGMAE